MKKLLYTMLTGLMLISIYMAPIQAIVNPNVITLNALSLDHRFGALPITATLSYMLKQWKMIVLSCNAWGNPSNVQVTDEVIQAHPDVLFVEICTADLPELKELYGITELSNFMFIRNDKLIYSLTGHCLWTSDLTSLIDTYLYWKL